MSLNDYISVSGQLKEQESIYIIKQVLEGINYIHDQGYIHCDIKSRNILLNFDADGVVKDVKICDFGLTKYDSGNLTVSANTCGTLQYMAPEMLIDQNKYSKSVEAWSLGVLLCRMLTGYLPFAS